MEASSPFGQETESFSPYAVVRRWHQPHGLAVAVALPKLTEDVAPATLLQLHPDERAWAATQPPRRRLTWVGGRLALRTALRELGVEAGPLFATDRGAPILPPGVAGSVSHKAGALAVALVDHHSGWQLGVDMELLHPARPGIARKVLTPGEQERLAGFSPEELWRHVLIRFSMKEAIYKALDPFVRRYVDFHEVEIDLHADGTATITMALRQGEGPFRVEAQVCFLGVGEVLTTARIRPG